MMEPFETIDIQELPLSVPMIRRKVEDFLGSNGLRLGEVDLYLAVLSEEGSILAGGGLHICKRGQCRTAYRKKLKDRA